MSLRNGDRSRHQINQKRKRLLRQRVRALRATLLGSAGAASAPGTKAKSREK
jgi:hypothetical protein